MYMKDRLQQFMKEESISPAKFADEIGVQRSSISHVLSGRNNPGYEFIQRILKRYPSINAEWLILGTGLMYKPVVQASLFENKENAAKNGGQLLFDTVMSSSLNTPQSNIQGNLDSEAVKSNPADIKVQPEPNTGSTIQRIVIFYTDHSFSDYAPLKNH
jgi:transcriptional regulator with XRE-family HTH domain